MLGRCYVQLGQGEAEGFHHCLLVHFKGKDTNSFHASIVYTCFILCCVLHNLERRLQASCYLLRAQPANPVRFYPNAMTMAHTVGRPVCFPPQLHADCHPTIILQHLFRLPLIRFGVLERKSTRSLVRPSLPADSSITTSKQNAPQRYHGQETRAQRTETKRRDARLGPHCVAVKCVDGVEDCRYSECRESVRSFWVFGRGCGACKEGLASCHLARWRVGKNKPSDKRLESGTEPVSNTVSTPSVMSEKPRVREK